MSGLTITGVVVLFVGVLAGQGLAAYRVAADESATMDRKAGPPPAPAPGKSRSRPRHFS